MTPLAKRHLEDGVEPQAVAGCQWLRQRGPRPVPHDDGAGAVEPVVGQRVAAVRIPRLATVVQELDWDRDADAGLELPGDPVPRDLDHPRSRRRRRRERHQRDQHPKRESTVSCRGLLHPRREYTHARPPPDQGLGDRGWG